MTPTRVFVVAQTPMARAGLRSMLASVGGVEIRVLGESASPSSAVPELAAADVVLVADEDLLEEVALAVAGDATQGLILFSEDEGAAARLRAMPLGGWGVVPPGAPPEELGAAVAAAAQGLVVFPKEMADGALAEPTTVEELAEPPTAREREVLALLAQGFSNKMVARELHISEHTVKFHVSSLYAKLDVNNRAEAVSQGARHGLISL